MTPLRRRMLEDMQIRNFSERAQDTYLRNVALFARHFRQSPEALGPEQIRIVMAWNTSKMQAILNRWNARRSSAVSPELIGRVAPTRTESINLRGVFRFPIEQYAGQLLPSSPAAKSAAGGR